MTEMNDAMPDFVRRAMADWWGVDGGNALICGHLDEAAEAGETADGFIFLDGLGCAGCTAGSLDFVSGSGVPVGCAACGEAWPLAPGGCEAAAFGAGGRLVVVVPLCPGCAAAA